MAEEQINIRVREDGSVGVRRNLDSLGDTAESSAGKVDLLEKALGALAAVLTVQKITEWADAWTTASGMIANATKNTKEAQVVQDRLFAAAQRTGSSYSAMVEMYARVQRGAKDMGKSQEDALKFSEGVGKALKVQGVSAKDAEGALLQLGQMLSASNIQMEEYASLLDATPALLQIVANNLDGTSGSVGKMTQMIKDGKVTSAQFFEAFMAGQGQLQEQFEKSGATFSGAWTKLENAAMKYVGSLNEATAASKTFDAVIGFLADHFAAIVASLGAVAIAIAAAFTPTLLVAFMGALRTLWALVLANPLTALAAAVAALITYIAVFGDEITIGIDKTTTLLDLFRAVGQIGGEMFQAVSDAAGEAWDYITMASEDGSSAMFNNVQLANEDSASSYRAFYADVGDGFAGLMKAIARTIDAIAGLLTGLGIAIARVFGGIPDVISNVFSRAYNAVVDKMGGIANIAISGINKIRQAAGAEPIQLVNFDKKAVSGTTPEQYGANIAKSIADGFETQGGFMERQVDKVLKRAQDISAKRLSGGGTGVDLTGAMGKKLADTADDKAAKKKADDAKKAREKEQRELERLRNEFDSLINTISPVQGATIEYAKAQETLNKAAAKFPDVAAKKAEYLQMINRYYKDLMDPLGKVNREIDEQVGLLGMVADKRQVEAQVMATVQDLQRQGVNLTTQETAALREKLTALQRINEITMIQDSMRQNSSGGQLSQFDKEIEAAKGLMNDPASGFNQQDAAASFGSMLPDLFAGTQEQIDANLQKFSDMYYQIDQMRQANIISEQTATQMIAKVDAQMNEQRLSGMASTFGQLAQLSKSENSKIAAIGKAAAVTQATIDGVLAVQKALASAPPPANYALAAATGATAAMNVAQIMGVNLGFATGGSFKVGGSGGTDSQMVAFRASPGEQVSVNTPTQVRKGTEQGAGNTAQPQTQAIRVVNVVDPNMVGDFLGSPSGERVFMNVIQSNASAIKQIMNGTGA